VLAKFASASMTVAHEAADDEDIAARRSIAGWLFYVPDQVANMNFYGRCALLVAVMFYTFKIFRDTNIFYGDLGGHMLSLVLLPWHEAGHVFFRLLGQFMTIAGGTIMQHLFPLVLGFVLLVKNRNPFGGAICLWLLGYSWIYTGWYMHDAGDPQAMMVSGKSSAEDDGHDFVNIFSYMGGWWLLNATKIGIAVARFGQAVMLTGIAWGAFMLWQQKANLSDAVFAEGPFDRD
ncbi:MAG: hypothetical protein JWN94_3355, partial [Betaproteobacteria bacterium]|nr:hypothetical protein [Betaproteobacteria bacterium]